MTIAELAAAAPGFDWQSFIRGIGVNEDAILVSQPSAFTGEAKLLADAPIGVIRDLLIVRSLDGFSDVLPDAVAEEAFSFYGTALSGTPQMQERWKRAVDFTTGNMGERSEEHTSELQSLMRISYAVFCLKKKTVIAHQRTIHNN